MLALLPLELSDQEASAQEPSLAELLKRLEERDARIEQLVRRVEALEQRLRPQHRASRASASYASAAGAARAAAPRRTEPSPSGPRSTAQSRGTGAPGSFVVDEEAAERALERALTLEGALLLPPGVSEIEPSFTYTRRESDVAALFEVGGAITAGTRTVERDEFAAALDYRLGLPFDSQFEIGLPYNATHQSTEDTATAGALADSSDTGYGIGDVSIGFAKTLMRERGWRPDLVARVTYDSATGRSSDDGISLPGGFHELRGSLIALKRQDPLAFVGSFSYEKVFESDNVAPGDEYTFSLSALLAASPDTSLRLGLQQTFIDEVEQNGVEIAGSDQVQTTAIFGASSILGDGLFLNLTAGIGLTDDAPEYFVRASVPLRFDLPFGR